MQTPEMTIVIRQINESCNEDSSLDGKIVSTPSAPPLACPYGQASIEAYIANHLTD